MLLEICSLNNIYFCDQIKILLNKWLPICDCPFFHTGYSPCFSKASFQSEYLSHLWEPMHVTIFFQIALLIYVFHIFYLPVNTTASTFKITTDRSVNSSNALLTTKKGSLKQMIDYLLFSLPTVSLPSECLFLTNILKWVMLATWLNNWLPSTK